MVKALFPYRAANNRILALDPYARRFNGLIRRYTPHNAVVLSEKRRSVKCRWRAPVDLLTKNDRYAKYGDVVTTADVVSAVNEQMS